MNRFFFVLLAVFFLVSCGGSSSSDPNTVSISGSSNVFSVSELSGKRYVLINDINDEDYGLFHFNQTGELEAYINQPDGKNNSQWTVENGILKISGTTSISKLSTSSEGVISFKVTIEGLNGEGRGRLYPVIEFLESDIISANLNNQRFEFYQPEIFSSDIFNAYPSGVGSYRYDSEFWLNTQWNIRDGALVLNNVDESVYYQFSTSINSGSTQVLRIEEDNGFNIVHKSVFRKAFNDDLAFSAADVNGRILIDIEYDILDFQGESVFHFSVDGQLKRYSDDTQDESWLLENGLLQYADKKVIKNSDQASHLKYRRLNGKEGDLIPVIPLLASDVAGKRIKFTHKFGSEQTYTFNVDGKVSALENWEVTNDGALKISFVTDTVSFLDYYYLYDGNISNGKWVKGDVVIDSRFYYRSSAAESQEVNPLRQNRSESEFLIKNFWDSQF